MNADSQQAIFIIILDTPNESASLAKQRRKDNNCARVCNLVGFDCVIDGAARECGWMFPA
jgi:hypothetical protein